MAPVTNPITTTGVSNPGTTTIDTSGVSTFTPTITNSQGLTSQQMVDVANGKNVTPTNSSATTPLPTTSPVTSTTPTTTTPAPVVGTVTTPTSSTGREIYRVGQDIYNAATNQKIGATDFTNNWSGKSDVKEVAAPTTNNAPTPVADTTDSKNRDTVAQALNSGHYTAQDIATSTGLSLNDVNSVINTNPELQTIINKNAVTASYQPAIDAATAAMTSLNNGTYQLTAGEQAQVNQLQAQFDQAKAAMIQANSSLQNTSMLGMERSGLLESSNGQVMTQYSDLVTKNTQKVTDLDIQAASAIATLKQSLEDNDYKRASQAYDLANTVMSQKTQIITDTAKATSDMYARITANNKAQSDAITTQLNQQKLTQDVLKGSLANYAPAISEALTGDVTKDKAVLEQWAKSLGTDTATIFGAAQTYNMANADVKQQNALLLKGYTEVEPNTPGAAKVGDKYFMAPEKLTSTTYKGVTTFYDSKGNPVKTSSIGGGGIGGNNGSTPITYTKAQQLKLESSLGANWKTANRADQLKVLYPDKKPAATKTEQINEVQNALNSVKDLTTGYVSKEDWTKALNAWTGANYGTTAQFITQFGKYANASDSYKYNGINE